ncbi:unnamed protein product, partial [Owenia fusiformis]
ERVIKGQILLGSSKKLLQMPIANQSPSTFTKNGDHNNMSSLFGSSAIIFAKKFVNTSVIFSVSSLFCPWLEVKAVNISKYEKAIGWFIGHSLVEVKLRHNGKNQIKINTKDFVSNFVWY